MCDFVVKGKYANVKIMIKKTKQSSGAAGESGQKGALGGSYVVPLNL